jgi:hypothetical protein
VVVCFDDADKNVDELALGCFSDGDVREAGRANNR